MIQLFLVMTMSEQTLHKSIQVFVRSFGLLDQDQTPCGQPISVSQAHALQVLGEAEGIPQQVLAEQLGLDKSTTSRLVTHLVERGWTTKTVNPANRREAQLCLTPQGRKVLQEVNAAASTRFEAIWNRIPPERRPQVLESLALLTDALKETNA